MDRVESRVEGNGPPPGKNWAKASTLEAAKREAIAYLAQGQESQHQVPAVPIDEGEAIAHLWGRLGILLQRGNAAILGNRVPNFPDCQVDGIV